jgi:glycosyltransferase involved in cell wall biosynthesis
MLKTLHIITSIQRRWGGPAEVVKRTSGALKLLGHSVDVVCLDPSTDTDEDDAAFARVFRLGNGSGKYAFSLQLIRWLKEHAKEYDAIVVDGLWQFHGVAALIALRARKIPYFVMPHGMLDPWFRREKPVKYWKKLCYWMLIERFLVNGAKAVLYTAETEREHGRKAFPFYRANEQVTVVGTAPPPPSNHDEAADKKEQIMLFLGRIHQVKACDLLIRAFAEMLKKGHRYRLVIAGPDESGLGMQLREEANSLGIGDKITWTGMVTGADKWTLMRAADVLVLPSHHENFGIVVAEALACGVPALLSNKVGVWREVMADGAGLADDDTQAGITRLLMRWAEMPDAAKAAMRTAAKRCFDERYHVARVAQNYVRLVGGKGTQAAASLAPAME